MGQLRVRKRGTIAVTAALAIAGLFSTAAWQVSLWQGPKHVALYRANREARIYARATNARDEAEEENWRDLLTAASGATSEVNTTPDTDTDTSPDDKLLTYAGETIGIQLLGQYLALKQSGTYTAEAGERIGTSVAANLRYIPTFSRYSEESFVLDPDTSYEKALVYRSSLREALLPLFENRASEFELFARYVETEDPEYLASLEPVALRYKDAAERAAHVSVPSDAAEKHVRIVNALLVFASVLEAMARHGTDPFASAVLLQTYNAAEREVFYAFDALAGYYVRKSESYE